MNLQNTGTTKRDKSVRGSRGRLLGAAVASALLGLGGATQGAPLTWDADGQGPTIGGFGVWDEVTPRWFDGSLYTPWNNGNGDTAILGGVGGGIVQVNAGGTGAAQLTFNSNYTLINPGTSVSRITLTTGIVDTGNNVVEIVNPFGGSSGLIKEGSGTLLFHGNNNYTGDTLVNAGTFALANTRFANIPDLSNVVVAAGATFHLGINGGAYNDTVGGISGGGDIVFGKSLYGLGTIPGSGLTTAAGAIGGEISGNMTGIGGRFLIGGLTIGGVKLSGVNTFAGRMDIGAGSELQLTGGKALSDFVPVTMQAGSILTLLDNETISALGSTGATVAGNIPTINMNGFNLTLSGNSITGVGNGTASGIINMQFNGVISGIGKLIKSGKSIQQMSTGANVSTYSGGTDILDGILVVSNDSKLGDVSGAVTLNGGTLSNFASGATGTSLTHGRSIIIDANGGGIQVLNNDTVNRTTTVTGVVSGAGALAKSGPGTLLFANINNSFSGGMLVREGIVSSNVDSGTPFGTGGISLQTGRLSIAANVANAAVQIKAVTDSGATFRYGAGAEIEMIASSNTATVGLTIGDAATPANSFSILNRQNGGTLLVQPQYQGTAVSGISQLGGNLKLVVNGDVPLTNGIVSPSIVSTQTSTFSTVGDFLTYNTGTGFALGTYTSLDVTTAVGTDVVAQSAAATLTGNTSVYALKASQKIDGGFALRIGDGVGAAGAIFNGFGATNVASTSAIATSAIIFDGTDATIYVQNAARAGIDAPLSITGNGGLTKFGAGSLVLNKPATYTGPTRIAGGILAVSGNDFLPTTTDLILAGPRGTAFSGSVSAVLTDASNQNQSTFRLLAGATQSVRSLASDNQYAVVDLGTGTLTVNQNTDTTYRGVVIGPGGTLVKSGSGKLLMNPFDGATLGNSGTLTSNGTNPGSIALQAHLLPTYSKLRVTGGVFEINTAANMATVNSQAMGLPAIPVVATPDILTLDGGTLRISGIPTYLADFSAVPSVQNISSRMGMTLGAGGGTLDVANPFLLLTWQRGNGTNVGTDDLNILNGPGDFTKTGEGTVRLGIGNLNSGRFIIKQGRVQFQTGSTFGATPGVFTANALTFDGGVAESNAAGTIEATRGITITPNGGFMYGTWGVSSQLTGSGTLVKANSGAADSTLTLNAASPNFTGKLSLQGGVLALPVSDSLGTAALELLPKFPVYINKTTGLTDTTINNAVTLAAGSTIDIRVDGGTNSGALVLGGKITGPNNFYKSVALGSSTNGAGFGTLSLTNATNDFTGNVTVLTGILNVTANNALGSPSGATFVSHTGAGTVGGTLAFSNVTYTTPEPLHVAGEGHAGLGALRGLTGVSRFTGPVTLVNSAAVSAEAGATLELAGRVVGNSDLTKIGTGTVVLSNPNNNWGGVTTVTEGTLIFNADHRIGDLKIKANTLAQLGSGNKVVKSTSLEFGDYVNPDAKLDVNDGRVAVNYGVSTPFTDIRNAILAAYQPAQPIHWGGNGITSSLLPANAGKAIGYAEASDVLSPGGGSFGGEPVDGTTVLIRYTLGGDATLDGTVDFSDLVRLAQNYNDLSGTVVWSRGDFTYDGNVDFNDLVTLAQNYNLSLPTSPIPGAAAGFEADMQAAFASVPEPASLGVLAMGAVGLLGRRQRRSK